MLQEKITLHCWVGSVRQTHTTLVTRSRDVFTSAYVSNVGIGTDGQRLLAIGYQHCK